MIFFRCIGDGKMQKVRVAIIDSGVNQAHKRFAGDNFIGFGYQDGKIVENYEDTYGHGTAIYNIIRNQKEIEIINIKVYGIEEGLADSNIIGILRYLEEQGNVDVINLSLGIEISDHLEEMYEVCDSLVKKGVIILSAFDNVGSISYPAAFDNVIGVATGSNCTNIKHFEFFEDKVMNVGAYGAIQRLAWTNPPYIFLGGNSFACAHMTVIIANYIVQGITGQDRIMEKLREDALYVHQVELPERKTGIPFTIEKAALFPFNKEMHSLVRYADTLQFEIVAVYDSKYSGRVGATTKHVMNDEVQELVIQNIDKIDWDAFDTIIIGHLDELSSLTNRDELRRDLVLEAIARGKYVYAFDEIPESVIEKNKETVFCPRVVEADLPPWRYGKLFRTLKPILGVFGTSSKQGKFTLQLRLRKILQNRGIGVGQIGTEPSALLYGMDYVYPMGYNSAVHTREFDSVKYLNYIVREVEKKENDIILVGSQSGTVAYDTGNITLFNIPQYQFLLGTQPDTIILCVNPYDEIEYIARTIRFLESSIETKVIAIMVFPMDLESNWTGIYGRKKKIDDAKLEDLRKTLSTTFSMPVYALGNDEEEKLVDYILHYYTS